MINNLKKIKLAVIGLGYVGLPLALEFAKKRQVLGFDINKKRINELKIGIDKNLEIQKKNLLVKKKVKFTNNQKALESANCFIITVPTPIDKFKKPDLKPLLNASKIVGKVIKKKDLIIYESTVYPGCIEEKCVPVLEKFSNLKFNYDFFCGYSPERINPGDKKHTVSNIKKVTSGSTVKTADIVDNLYNEIISVGTFKAESIKVAEAAKVIENTQRDLNIALMNELSILFKKMNIDTQSVLDAAKTKWNFLPFEPGLVGGHCIGVDPYYLTFKAKVLGYKPKIILAGRELNDKMGSYVVTQLFKKIKEKKIRIKEPNILVMGLTFKENCADIRNSGVKKIIDGLKKHKCKVDIYDPWADVEEVRDIYNLELIQMNISKIYDAIIIAVAHDRFKKMGINKISNYGKKNCVIFDLKNLFKSSKVAFKL